MNDQLSEKDLDALYNSDDCVESNDQWSNDDITTLVALDN